MKRAILFAVVFVVALSLPGTAAVSLAAEKAAAPEAGTPAAPPPPPSYDAVGAPMPPVKLKAVNGGQEVDATKLAKPSLFLFVNSSCSSCRTEMSVLLGMAEKMKAKLDTYLVAVDFDPAGFTKRLPDQKMTEVYTILDDSAFALAGKLGFNYTPATLIVRDGKQVFRKGGYSPGDEDGIVAEVMKALK